MHHPKQYWPLHIRIGLRLIEYIDPFKESKFRDLYYLRWLRLWDVKPLDTPPRLELLQSWPRWIRVIWGLTSHISNLWLQLYKIFWRSTWVGFFSPVHLICSAGNGSGGSSSKSLCFSLSSLSPERPGLGATRLGSQSPKIHISRNRPAWALY